MEGLHPFTVAVIGEPIPENKMLHAIEKYDGSTDPDEHLQSFVDTMVLYSLNGLVWCKVFSLSLKGEALGWFHSLTPGIIDGFGTLRNLFNQQYASSRVQSLTYLGLVNIRQRKQETLKDFKDQFNKIIHQVKKDVGRKVYTEQSVDYLET